MLSSFVNINQPLVDKLSAATLVTANERLAREYRRGYALFHQAKDSAAWVTPDILSLRQYFTREYQDLAIEEPGAHPHLLSQEALIGQIYDVHPEAPAHLVSNFLNALQTTLAYELSLDEIRTHQRAGEFYADWAQEVLARIGETRLLAEQIPAYLSQFGKLPNRPLITVLLEQLSHSEMRYFGGLIESMPVLQLHHDRSLRKATTAQDLIDRPPEALNLPVPIYAAATPHEELREAAAWANNLHHTDANLRIGIIVPSVAHDHALVAREIGIRLDPHAGSDSVKFDISGGEPLADQAVWQAATHLLQLVFDRATRRDFAVITNSGFFPDFGLGVLLERWPRRLPTRLDFPTFQRHIKDNPLTKAIGASMVHPVPDLQPYDQWVQQFQAVLQQSGWPNLSDVGSRQFQAHTAIIDVLNSSLPSEPVSASAARRRLDYLLTGKLFAPERPPANLVVLGSLEANGLAFDHLWLCGMDEENFPARNPAIPFIPRALARASGVPRADQEDELEFSARLLRRWQGQADNLHASYVHSTDDAGRRHSPLLTQTSAFVSTVDHVPHWLPTRETKLELYSDEYGASVENEQNVRGGVRLVEDQAACPFRAYAVHRLQVPRVEHSADLPDALTRGILLHDVLHALFTIAKDSTALPNLSDSDVDLVITQAIQKLELALPAEFIKYERLRLRALVFAWLDVEQLREEFEIYALETTYEITFEQFTLTIRADRIDKIRSSGRLIVIDYKTGLVAIKGLDESPLERPQLPIYSQVDAEVYGAFYAAIHKDKVRFTGICDPEADPGAAINIPLKRSWAEQNLLWRNELTRLTQDYAQGFAAVEPIAGACDYCHLASFCRISEQQAS